uniref:uncharacterized protein LOC120331609 n=1 Tax=Styela clava TaxID=7725 RepID=UPI00193A52B7|nr:uncharacterized protein LOC120331609 [Styela clava]
MCGGETWNKTSIHVQYVSDGRTHDGSIVNPAMGFAIQYKISQCPTTSEATTDNVSTSIFEGSSYTEQTTSKIEDNRTLSTKDTENNDVATFRETDADNSDGISDTAKLFLVSIPGFIGIIILVVTAIVFCMKRGDKSQDGNKVKQENVSGNQVGNVESPTQEPDQDTTAAEHNEPTTSTSQEEEAPYTIMYSTLARKDEEDKKETIRAENKTSAIEEDEHKYDMYSVVVRKTEGGDKKTIHDDHTTVVLFSLR